MGADLHKVQHVEGGQKEGHKNVAVSCQKCCYFFVFYTAVHPAAT